MSVTALELTVDGDLSTCAQGYTAQFRAIATIGSEGMTFDVTDQVTFDGIDAIGDIDNHGLFIGTTVGDSTITANYTATNLAGDEISVDSNEVEFEVTDAVLESITITSNNFGEDAPQIVNTDDSLVFMATGHFSYGDDQELTDVTWTSSDESVATIDADGAVLPMDDTFGQTKITATSADGDVSADIMLSTYDALSVTALELTVDGDLTSVANGGTAQFRAVATMGSTGMTFDVTNLVTFDGIDAIGDIDEHGLFTATTVGTSTITANYTAINLAGDEISVDSNEIEFSVTDAVLESIVITSSDGMTDFGEDAPQILNDNMSLIFTATGHFSDGSEQELDDVTWESSDTGIAIIDGSTGVVTPETSAWGQTKITVTSADGDVTSSIMLSTADAMAVTNVEIAVDGDLTEIANGMHAQFRVYATIGSAADTYEVTDQVTWEGIDGLGDIDAHGLFTATTVGATDAIATYRDVTSDPYFFEVTDAVVDSIEIIPANPMILNVDTKEFTAKAILSDGTEISPLDASDLTWSSSDDTICAIDADGIATPAADKWGQVVISVSYEDPNTGDTYDGETTLSIGDAMAVNSLTISAVEPADAVTVAMGGKVRYQAIATVGTNDQEFDVTGLVDWSVEGDAIGSIDELGWLEPVAAGTATISAQLTIDNLSGSQTVDSDNDLNLEVTD